MKTLLQINAGLQGPVSQSSKLADKMTDALRARMPEMALIKRDLSEGNIPHLNFATFQTFMDPAAAVTPAQKADLALSDRLVSELKDADILVLGAPMYNLMIPSTLKSWIDYVTRAGETFQFTKERPVGLLTNKTAYIVLTQGGQFLGTNADLQSGYLTMALGLMGITEINFIYGQGLAMGRQATEVGLKAAHDKIGDLCKSAA